MMQESRPIRCGALTIGGGARITVQSMTNTDTRDAEATGAQIKALVAAGCDIVRVSVYDDKCIEALPAIRAACPAPLVADIHFDHTLAIKAAECGVDKLRINPGNIGGAHNVAQLAHCARAHGIPIRIGVNGGSLEKALLGKYGGPTPEAMVESALGHIKMLEDNGFYDIIVAIKSSSVADTIAANRLMRGACPYPLHLGITEAGTERMSVVKSSIGIGALLADGIGDTIRVSITGDPVREVRAGKDILRALRLLRDGAEVVSCPTCGRCGVDLPRIADEVERRLEHIKTPIVAAVMGCVVNGPGEARGANVAITCGKGSGALYRDGVFVRKVEERALADALVEEAEAYIADTSPKQDDGACPGGETAEA